MRVNDRFSSFLYSNTHGSRVLRKSYIVIALVLYVAVRLWKLSVLPFWLDEVFTAHAVNGSWRHMFRAIVADKIHPPFYYILVKIWVSVFGFSLIAFRSLSVCISILAFLVLVRLIRDLEISPIAEFFVLLAVSVNTLLIGEAQEARMYSLLLLLSLLAIFIYLREKSYLQLTAVTTGLLLTHLSGIAVVGAVMVHALCHARNRSKVMLSCLAASFCLGVWLFCVYVSNGNLSFSQQLGWIHSKPNLHALTSFYAEIAGGWGIRYSATFGLLLFVVAIGISWHRTKEKREATLLAFLAVAPAVALLAVSQSHSLWVDRYLTICIVPFLLLAAYKTREFSRVLLAWVAVSAICVPHLPAWTRYDLLAERAYQTRLPIYVDNLRTELPIEYALQSEGLPSSVRIAHSIPSGSFALIETEPSELDRELAMTASCHSSELMLSNVTAAFRVDCPAVSGQKY